MSDLLQKKKNSCQTSATLCLVTKLKFRFGKLKIKVKEIICKMYFTTYLKKTYFRLKNAAFFKHCTLNLLKYHTNTKLLTLLFILQPTVGLMKALISVLKQI